MKIVLAGTGYIGTEILDQCLTHHYIHHVYVLTRKPLDEKYRTHKKVTQLQHDDFSSLPDSLYNQFKTWGVTGCIWALGPRAALKSADEMQKVGVTFPVNAAEQFAKHVAPEAVRNQTGKVRPFRFVFISGSGAEQDQFRQLWYSGAWRKMKGAAEKGLFDVAASSESVNGKRCLEVVSLRAGSAVAGGQAVTSIVSMATTTSIAVDLLAKCAIRVVLDGDAEGRTILENVDCLGDDWAQINTIRLS